MKHVSIQPGSLAAAVAGALLCGSVAGAAVVDSFDSYDPGVMGSTNAQAGWSWTNAWSVSGASALGSGQGIEESVTTPWAQTTHIGGEQVWAVGQTVSVQSDFRMQIADASSTPQVAYMILATGDHSATPWSYGQLRFGIDFVGNTWKSFAGQYQFSAYNQLSSGGADFTTSYGGSDQIPGLVGGVGTSHWLSLKTDVTKGTVAGTGDITMTLYDLGVDGTSAPTVARTWTYTGANIASDVYDAGLVTGGYASQDPTGLTALYADNFSIAVPEPATIGLLGVVVGGMLIRRRRVA